MKIEANDCVMSRSEAAALLMDMSKGASRDECEALQLGVRALVKRHFDCMKNRTVRKAKKNETDTHGKQHGVRA